MTTLFGGLAGIIFLKEAVTPSVVIGGVLILAALVLSEVRPGRKKFEE